LQNEVQQNKEKNRSKPINIILLH